LNRNGLKISKIACLNKEELAEQVSSVARETWSYESQIENIMLAMIDLDEKMFEKILSKCIMQMGFEDAVLKVLYPFFIRIGLMWQTGSVNPAQEHFISNLTRQKIIVAIDGVIPREISNAGKFILFLPDGELHELALLFMYYLIKKRGHKAIYLGQSIPLNDVSSVQDTFNADYVITYYTSSVSLKDLRKQVSDMSKVFSNVKILIAGTQVGVLENLSEPNVERMNSLQHLVEILDAR
jgi:methanogenic corrinoid protein MtbC1